jgi:protein-tyrosine phosphatase
MGMVWFHLPVQDGCAPGYIFEGRWLKASLGLHEILDKGGKILIHCRCGRGREELLLLRF